jgi:hypothetical protein
MLRYTTLRLLSVFAFLTTINWCRSERTHGGILRAMQRSVDVRAYALWSILCVMRTFEGLLVVKNRLKMAAVIYNKWYLCFSWHCSSDVCRSAVRCVQWNSDFKAWAVMYVFNGGSRVSMPVKPVAKDGAVCSTFLLQTACVLCWFYSSPSTCNGESFYTSFLTEDL